MNIFSDTKSIFASKVLWVNALIAILEGADTFFATNITDPQTLLIITLVTNFILRFFTSKKVVTSK